MAAHLPSVKHEQDAIFIIYISMCEQHIPRQFTQFDTTPKVM